MKVLRCMAGGLMLLSALTLSACAFSGQNNPPAESPQTSVGSEVEKTAPITSETELSVPSAVSGESSATVSEEEEASVSSEPDAEESSVPSDPASETVSETVSEPSSETKTSTPPQSPGEESAVSPESSSPSSEEPAAAEAEGEFVTFMTSAVNVADDGVKADTVFSAGKDNASFFIHSGEQLRQFSNDYRDVCSLDAVDDGGQTFDQATAEMDDSFFERNFLIVTMQKYKKTDSIELFDLRKNSSGLVIDVYKNLPENEAQTGYMLYLVSGSKEDLTAEQVRVNVYPADSFMAEGEEDEEDIIILE